jgi:DNA polymerase-3 subunit delta'
MSNLLAAAAEPNAIRYQDAAIERIDKALRGGRLPHAYIFAGPDGVGKRRVALRLAQRLLCADPPADGGVRGCGTCDECVAVVSETHVDLHLIHRTLAKLHPDPDVRKRQALELGVDVVRHFVTEPATHQPARGRAKIFIIDEAERMNWQAQNALLKTLEEPPGASYLMLITTTAERLLPTTRSRAQTIPFARLPDEFVAEQLAARTELSDAEIGWLAGFAQGSLGSAMRFAEAGLHARRTAVLDLVFTVLDDALAFSRDIQALIKKTVDDGVITVEAAGSDSAVNRATQRLVLAMLGAALRDVLRVSAGGAPKAYAAGDAGIERLAGRLSPAAAGEAVRAVARSETVLEQNANVGLAFDSLGIEIQSAAN